MRSYLAILAPYNIPMSTHAAGTQSDDGFFVFPVPDSQMLGGLASLAGLALLAAATSFAGGVTWEGFTLALKACPVFNSCLAASICTASSACKASGQELAAISLALSDCEAQLRPKALTWEVMRAAHALMNRHQ